MADYVDFLVVLLPNAETAVCEYGNVVFRASLYMLGEICSQQY